MNPEIKAYVDKAREHHLTDEKIQEQLLSAGWEAPDVSLALSGDDLVVPRPPQHAKHDEKAPRQESQLLSEYDQSMKSVIFEYHIMFITLWVVAIAAFWTMNLALFANLSDATFPLTAVIVCLPVLTVFFLRRRTAERKDPNIKRLKDRLNLIHGTQSLAFLLLLIHTIYLVYQLISLNDSLEQQITSWAFSLVIFGGIFAYYWSDTHATTPRAS